MHEVADSALLRNTLIRRLVSLVTELRLDRDDFVIFGSAPLLAHGLRKSIRDLDIVARGTTWRRVCQYGEKSVGSLNDAPMVLFWGGRIQFSSGWISEEWDTDNLIDGGEIIYGLRFAQLADVLAYKEVLRRSKDLPDIEALATLFSNPTYGRTRVPLRPMTSLS